MSPIIRSVSFSPAKSVKCKGNSIWANTRGLISKVSKIVVEVSDIDDEPTIDVWVRHDSPWEVYTDTGFEKGISELLSKAIGRKVKISFTEQGMQEKGWASMEVEGSTKPLAKWVFDGYSDSYKLVMDIVKL